MGKYAVTQGQWEAVMGNNPSYFKGASRPVEKVSWYDATKFCQKLSQITGKNIVYPVRVNGNMLVEPEQQHHFILERL
jgi:Uncharacterized conserved protein